MGAVQPLLLVGALLLLASCAGAFGPRPMPSADGSAMPVELDNRDYVVTRTALASAPGGEVMRVYRPSGASFDYSEGKLAKDVAEAFCEGYSRKLSPSAQGMFEPTGAWVFPGGCA